MGMNSREPEEDTGAIQTFTVTDEHVDMEFENPDVVDQRAMIEDYEAAQVLALETAWMNAQNEYQKAQKEQKNYPRIDVMIDKNCLISYTGHMSDFPSEVFQEIIDKAVVARLDIEALVNERIKNMPRDMYEQTGYQ